MHTVTGIAEYIQLKIIHGLLKLHNHITSNIFTNIRRATIKWKCLVTSLKHEWRDYVANMSEPILQTKLPMMVAINGNKQIAIR